MPFDAAPRPAGSVDVDQRSAVAPFVVFALPRSGTAWTARLLTYGDWTCGHDEIRHMRSLDDVKAWLGQPCTGTAETAGAPFWRTLMALQPNARVVIIRRPVGDVVESLLRLDMRGVCTWDRAVLTRAISRLDAKLDQIEARVPGVLSVRFADLFTEPTSARLFEYCLPYRHDHAWWAAGSPVNVQCNMPAMMRYMIANREALETLARIAKQRTIFRMQRRETEIEGVTIQEESFDSWLRDSGELIKEHLATIGEDPSHFQNKNFPLHRNLESVGALQVMTARCNGRVFGYLISVIGPTLASDTNTMGVHTHFYASPLFPGLGRKLQNASIDAMRRRGVDDAFMRAGVRGAGPRLGSLYRRLGASECGSLYHISLKGL